MRYRITKPNGILNGTIELEGSKSISNRALIIRALSKENFELINLSPSDDTQVLARLLEEMPSTLDVGAAGTAMRFLTAYLAITEGEWTLTGSARMQERPIGILVDALKELGADIEYLGEQGYPPLRIKGKPLKGGQVTIPADVSSQFVSALLLIGPYLEGGLAMELTGEVSSGSYINLTRQVMGRFGVFAHWEELLEVGEQDYKGESFKVEADWSAASYFYNILALSGTGELSILGLQEVSEQGDSICKSIYDGLGLSSTFEDDRLLIECEMNPDIDEFYNDFTDCPDIAQTLAVTCAGLSLPASFSGLESLKIKETDRVAALQTELEKFGVVLRQDEEGDWELENGVTHQGIVVAVDTYEDHRMAMAFAGLAIVLPSIEIENPAVVSKSYPGFWDALREIGFGIEEID